jgi:hypothetical protein
VRPQDRRGRRTPAYISRTGRGVAPMSAATSTPRRDAFELIAGRPPNRPTSSHATRAARATPAPRL